MFPTVASFVILGVITAVFAGLALREEILRRSGE
jgi:hypothetical protein